MRILGIEFGTWSLKAVEMESRFRRTEILDFHEVRLPLQITDATETYRQAITQLLARLPSHPEKVVTSLPAAQIALRFLPIPIKQRKQVEKTFRFELEDSVPFKLDDAIIEHFVSRTKEGSLVFAAIAPKRFVTNHVTWLNSVGIDPDWLTFEGMGVLNLYLSQVDPKVPEKFEGPLVLLDIGHLKTNIAIVDQDRLMLFRSIAWGGANITQSIAMSLGVSLEEAERLKMNDLKLDDEGAKDNAELLEAANEAFTPFIADLNHSIVSFRNSYKMEVQSALLTGGTSKTWGIETLFRKRLGLTTRFFHPFEGFSLKGDLKSADEYRFSEPLGRSLVFGRNTGMLFNFRQQEASKGTSLNEITTFLKAPSAILLLTLVGIFTGILFVHVFFAGLLAQQESKVATEELRKAFAQTFPAVPAKLKQGLTSNPRDLKKFIDQKNNELEQKLKMVSKSRTPMMSMIKTISESFPPEVRVDVNTLQVDDRAFLVEGVLYSGNLDTVTESLKKLPTLNNVALTRDGQRFTFKGEVVGR